MLDLLEYLSDKLHCVYLSDLHYITVTPQEAGSLLDLSDHTFSLEDYQQALDYLTGGHDGATDLSVARKTLIDTLTRLK